MPYERCRNVAENFWPALQQADPEEVVARTWAVFEEGRFYLPFLNRTLVINPARTSGQLDGAANDPGFRVCLTALLYLLHLNPARL